MEEKQRRIFKDVKINDRWYVDIDDEVKEFLEAIAKAEGFIRIERPSAIPGAKVVSYGNQDDYIEINSKPVKKVEAIMDHFGASEWMEVLRSEAGLKPEAGLQGLHRLIENKEASAKYRTIRDHYAQMAKEALENKSGVVRHGY